MNEKVSIAGGALFVSGALGASWNKFVFDREHPELVNQAMKDYIHFAKPLAEWDAAEWFGASAGVTMLGLMLLAPLLIAALKMSVGGCTHAHHHHS